MKGFLKRLGTVFQRSLVCFPSLGNVETPLTLQLKIMQGQNDLLREEKVCWERDYPIIYLVLGISSFFCISIYTSNTDQEKKKVSVVSGRASQPSRAGAHKPFLSSRSQTLSHQLLQDGLCPRLGCKRTAASTRHLSYSKGMGEPRSHKVFFFFGVLFRQVFTARSSFFFFFKFLIYTY